MTVGEGLMNRIITIGREFGSGGRELGRRLAEELGIQYYDKEILREISHDTSLSEDYLKGIVDKKPNFLFPITIGRSFSLSDDYHIKQMQTVYQSQSNIIHQLAEKSDCVIIGRCADYILRDMHPFRIFVYASMASRIKRCQERSAANENLTDKEMRNKILTIDKNRSRHYEDFTGQKWGDRVYYDFCINTTDANIKEIAPHLAKMFISNCGE